CLSALDSSWPKPPVTYCTPFAVCTGGSCACAAVARIAPVASTAARLLRLTTVTLRIRRRIRKAGIIFGHDLVGLHVVFQGFFARIFDLRSLPRIVPITIGVRRTGRHIATGIRGITWPEVGLRQAGPGQAD